MPLIKLITTQGPDLLVNVSEALGQCAKDRDVLQAVIDIDGVRLLWSLLKNPFEKVKTHKTLTKKIFMFKERIYASLIIPVCYQAIRRSNNYV